MTSTKWEEKECNRRLIDQTIEKVGISSTSMEQILHHYFNYTAATIRSGTLEGVYYPYLGKFQVKAKVLQQKEFLSTLHPVLRKELQRVNLNNIFNDDPITQGHPADVLEAQPDSLDPDHPGTGTPDLVDGSLPADGPADAADHDTGDRLSAGLLPDPQIPDA